MKLVIDIPEKAYKRIQSLSNADYFGHDICGNSMRRIANGTPYEERPHGVWKEVCDFDGKHYKWECSMCGRLEEFEEDFCNCGADMRKEGDEK